MWQRLQVTGRNPLVQPRSGKEGWFNLALITGLSVADISQNGINLGWDEVRLPAPVFEGDTLYAHSVVMDKREPKSRPMMGIVRVRTTGINQDGTVVIEFVRTIMVYKQAHKPSGFRPPRPVSGG